MQPIIRNLRFDLESSVPEQWHPAAKSVSTFFDNLSIFFPAGERFFVASVRAYAARIDDPRLRDDVRAFCGQEGIHGREHQRYNAWLKRRGVPVDAMEGRVERLLARVSRRASKRQRLAITCALEHFTALMGHVLLEDPRLLDGAHPTMRDLWRWHAAEENEHKTVAYDVFVAAGGTYAERAFAMLGATIVFWAKVLEHQVRMMRVDGTLASFGEWRALVRFLFVEPGGLRQILRHYGAYFRRDFHPSQIDSAALLARWRAEYGAPPSDPRAAA